MCCIHNHAEANRWYFRHWTIDLSRATMTTRYLSKVLLTMLLAMPAAAQASTSCTASMTNVSFGASDPFTGWGGVTATLNYQCNTGGLALLATARVRLCFSIGVVLEVAALLFMVTSFLLKTQLSQGVTVTTFRMLLMHSCPFEPMRRWSVRHYGLLAALVVVHLAGLAVFPSSLAPPSRRAAIRCFLFKT